MHYKMSTSSCMSDSDDSGYEVYRAIPRPRMTHISMHKTVHRPVKSFRISDILGKDDDRDSGMRNNRPRAVVSSAKIVRPWDDSPSKCLRSDNSSDSEEEINVEDIDPPTPVCLKTKSVSPLDALLQMTTKTFQGLDSLDNSDPRNRDQNSFLGKSKQSKKRRKSRTAFTNQQIYELEKRFLYQKYLTPADRDEIAQRLSLTNAQVITWFQNRRAKLKRELEELKNDVNAAKKLTTTDVKLELIESKQLSPLSEASYEKCDEDMDTDRSDVSNSE